MSVLIERQGPGTTKKLRQNRAAEIEEEELVAFCPNCKTFETLWFTSDGLIKTQKFSQEGSQVYHDCGGNEPCRLLPCFLKKG